MSADENTVRAVTRAWTVPGPAPLIHYAAKNRLRSEWPALATALDELCRPQSIFLSGWKAGCPVHLHAHCECPKVPVRVDGPL